MALPPIVPSAWPADHAGDVVLADVRWYLDGRSGHDAYLAGHLPGAIWVDVDGDLSGAPGPAAGRHPLPTAEAFAARLGALGIGDDDVVVAYDDQGGSIAARLVWLLRVLGQDAAVLDGGLAAWPGPVDTGEVRRPPVARRARPWPAEAFRDAESVAAAARAPGALVLDARAAARYTGQDGLPSETRRGHVPGARNAPWAENLRADGTFRDPAELRARYDALGAAEADEVVVYCGSGVTACHDLLALEHAGLGRGALYPGSWSAWIGDPERPVATGD